MAKVRIELNHSAVRQLLRSDEVKADLERRAKRIADAAGPGHDVDVSTGRNRARADVATESFAARYRESTERTLTRAIDAGR